MEKVRDGHEDIVGKSIPGRGDGRCKGPGAGVNQACLKNSKEASGAGADSARGTVYQAMVTCAMGVDQRL